MLKFHKMNGAGNDFVLLDNRHGELLLTPRQIARLCDRHRGVGADGLLLVEPPRNGAHFRMRYFNSDGGEAEMCGNGARCFARYTQSLTSASGGINFETEAGVIHAEFQGELVSLGMSQPLDLRLDQPVQIADGGVVTVHSLNTGVPHAVVFVDHLEKIDVQNLGSELRWHPAFAPKGTNVNFVRKLSDHVIAIRTYERGVEGETLACGTGVVASAIIYALTRQIAGPISVQVRGGDLLEVAFEHDFEHEGGEISNVILTGPADFAFSGEIEIQD